MSKTKSEKIADIQKEIEQLANRKKELIQKQKSEERNARTKRLIERGAILESLIADSETLSNEEIKAFLGKTITSGYALKMLDGIKAQSNAVAHEEPEAV